MREPPELRDLVGDDLDREELERLRAVDRLLRAVPGPPAEVPASLTAAVARLGQSGRAWAPRRLAAAAALAATLAAVFFGLGRWSGSEGLETGRTVAMEPAAAASEASALIRVGERDEETGNWQLELDVSGLPPLEEGSYYVLWLAKDGEYAGTCGTFNVGEGETTVRMTVSYRLADYDAWVVSEAGEDSPWLLSAPIRT